VFAKHCEKENSGLFVHAWSEQPDKTMWADPKSGLSPEVWSEGLGWYALILVETLAVLPKDHPKRSAVEGIYRRLAAGLLCTQDAETGGWFMIVDRGDRSDNWIDPSGTAMFVYSIQRGIELNLLGRNEYGEVAERGYRALLAFARINEKGLVDIHGGGDGITVKKDYETYVRVPRMVNAKEAVGGFLWASAIMEKPELERTKKR
jgi:unsaturated rhamnogalacturonyl hydrolase